jgi:hypothetical protein
MIQIWHIIYGEEQVNKVLYQKKRTGKQSDFYVTVKKK